MKMKPWIIAGVSCLCAGTICCGAAVCAGALDQNRYRENMHLIDQTDTPSETFTSVLMDIDNADVTVQKRQQIFHCRRKMCRRTATMLP